MGVSFCQACRRMQSSLHACRIRRGGWEWFLTGWWWVGEKFSTSCTVTHCTRTRPWIELSLFSNPAYASQGHSSHMQHSTSPPVWDVRPSKDRAVKIFASRGLTDGSVARWCGSRCQPIYNTGSAIGLVACSMGKQSLRCIEH